LLNLGPGIDPIIPLHLIKSPLSVVISIHQIRSRIPLCVH
jgi:hypothetical protein